MNTPQSTTFSALSEPTRLRIIDMLALYGELSASEISSKFSSTASAVSQHLKVLREAQLVVMRKKAQQRIYQLDVNTMVELEHWVNLRTHQWNGRLDSMDEYIHQLKKD